MTNHRAVGLMGFHKGLAMKLRSLKSTLGVLLFFLAISVPAFSQAVNGTLIGTITDSTAASVPNASVVITEVNTGVSRSSTTNESGNYSFPDLPPGTYSVTVDQPGFKRSTRVNVEVQVNSYPRIDLTLQAS